MKIPTFSSRIIEDALEVDPSPPCRENHKLQNLEILRSGISQVEEEQQLKPKRKRIDVTVTLSEPKKEAQSSQITTQGLTPREVIKQTRDIIDRLHGNDSKLNNSKSQKELGFHQVKSIKSNAQFRKFDIDAEKNGPIKALSRNRENQLKTENTRSMSQRFLNNTGEDIKQGSIFNQTVAFPQLSARVTEIDVIEKQSDQKKSTLQDLGKRGIQFYNPFIDRSEAQTIGRNLSALGFPNQSSSNIKKYLPNIMKNEKVTTISAEPKRLKVVMKKDVESFSQDVSYLKEQNTPTQKATILTTGDRGQDDLLEATMGFKNLGKSLINLPSTLEELKLILKCYQQNRQQSNALSLLQTPDDEEKILERYLQENFCPLEALQKLQEDGKLYPETLMKIGLPNTKLSQYLQQRTSPRRKYLQGDSSMNRSPAPENAQLFNVQHKNSDHLKPHPVNPHKLNDSLPIVNTKPEELILINGRLMKKFGEDAFINQLDQIPLKRKAKPTEPIAHSEQTNLFGDVVTQVAETPMKYSGPSDLGNPSSRQDAIILIEWFEQILKKIVVNKGTSHQSEYDYQQIQLVMNICMKELTRQVSVQCVERGQLLKRIFNSYIRFMELLNVDHCKKRKNIKNDYALKLDRYVTILDQQAQGYREQIQELEAGNRLLKSQLEDTQKLVKEKVNIAQKFKRKCYLSQRELEANQTKLRYFEKENKQLKHKISDIKEEFHLEISDLDEQDRQRIMLEVERELSDIDREQHQQSRFNITKSSFIESTLDNDLTNVLDKDLIGEEERGTSTADFQAYIHSLNLIHQNDQTIQTHVDHLDAHIGVDAYQLKAMVDQTTDAQELVINLEEEKRKSKIEVLEQQLYGEVQNFNIENVDESEEDENSDLSDLEDIDKQELRDIVTMDLDDRSPYDKNGSRSQNQSRQSPFTRRSSQLGHISQPQKTFSSRNLSDNKKTASPAQTASNLIQFLALSLARRTTQILDKEHHKVQKLAEICPDSIATKLKSNFKQTLEDVEELKSDILGKQKIIRRQMKQYKRTERSLRYSNEKVDALEMDNYNLREQVSEQLKMLDDFKALIAELQSIIEAQNLKPSEQAEQRIKELVLQLNDFLIQNQQKALQLTLLEDNDNVVSINTIGLRDNMTPDYINSNSNTLQAVNTNTPDKSQKQFNSQDFSRKKTIRGQQVTKENKRISIAKAKGSHPAYVILRKILAKDPKKLKDIMPRKMLLRVIYQVYQERGTFDKIPENNTQQQQLQTQQSSVSQQLHQSPNQPSSSSFQASQQSQTSLIEWIYDTFMQKYGLKNVAERKFNQLIASCIAYKDQLPRIYLFGRFLEAYDDLPPTDYNRYLKLNGLFSTSILNFKVDENLESTLVPLSRTIDYFKFKFESKQVPHVFNHRLHMIEKKKMMVTSEDIKAQRHLKGAREALDYDWFASYVIDNYIFIEDDKISQVKDLFYALDARNTGYMKLSGFEMLMKLFHYKPTKYLKRIFDEYAKPQDAFNPLSQKTLSLDQFLVLSVEREFFTPKIQMTIMNSKNPEKDFETLSNQLASVVSLLRARLVAIEMITDPTSMEFLENLQECVRAPKSQRVGWVCYRITDEIIKRLFLKKTSESYMPVDLSMMTEVRLKPSAQLVTTLPINCFDTQQ